MTDKLFTRPNFGGDVGGHWAQARAFMGQARGATPGAEEVAGATADATRGLPAADVAPGAGAPTAMAEPVALNVASGSDPDGLAAAARAAADHSIADPAFVGAARQQVEVVVQPRLIVERQRGPIVVPVDVVVPAAHTTVTIAPAQAIVVDAATGQPIAAGASAATEAAPASAARGFRNWDVADIGALLGGGRASAAAAEQVPTVAAQATDAGVPPATARASLREQLGSMFQTARESATPAATVVADAAPPAPAGPSLLDRIRANTAGLGGTFTGSGAVDNVAVAGVDEVARATGAAGARDQLLKAFELAKRAAPKV